MTGVLAERAGNFVPSAIAASSWVFVYWSFVTFRRRHQWEHLQVWPTWTKDEQIIPPIIG